MGHFRGNVLRLCCLMKFWSKNSAVALLSTMAAVVMSHFPSLIFTGIQKCNEVVSIVQVVYMVHKSREWYKEVADITNCWEGALGAAETGTLFKNPPGRCLGTSH